MRIKRLLRRFGYDVVRYRSYYDSVLVPMSPKTVIDIGANTGAFSEEMRGTFPHARIYAFEPLNDCFEDIQKRMVGDENFKAWQAALGEASGDAVIQRSSFHPSSSLLPMSGLHKDIYPKSKDSVEERVKIMRLDDALAVEKLENPIFIKMDVQGFEDKVIAGGSDIIRRAAAVQIETSFVILYEGQPLFEDIARQMEDLGFAYRGEAARHYDAKGKLIYQDSIFLAR